MKDRILQQLYGISRGLPESETYLQHIRKRILLPEKELRSRAAEVLVHILHNYDRFRVETIDAFFQSVLTDLAHELNLPANFQIDINDKEVIHTAVDQLIDGLTPNTPLLTWILSYVRERIEDNRRWDIHKEVKDFAMNLSKEKYLANEEALHEKLSDNATLQSYRNRLCELRDMSVDVLKSAADHFEETMLENDVNEKSFNRGTVLTTYLNNMRSLDFKEPSATLLNYMESYEYWLRKADLKNSHLIEIIERTLRPLLNEIETIRKEQENLFNSCLLTLQHLNPLRLLNSISEKANSINEEANRFMLAKTPILLNRLIGKDDASFIFEKSGTRFHHIMIDEFQDTSTLQWKNFKNLLLENMAGGNHNLLVGDIKQSIYRWRNGDWSTLYNIATEFPAYPAEIRNLATNFRSEKQIIDFNNRFFKQAAQILDSLKEPEDPTIIADLYVDVEQLCSASKEKDPQGYVQISLLDKKAETEEGEDWEDIMLDSMAEEIISLTSQGLPLNQIAILIRSNKDIPPIVNYFTDKCPDIHIVSDEAFLLASSQAVQLVVNALRYLNNPTDDLAHTYLIKHYRTDILQESFRYEMLQNKDEELLPSAFLQLQSNQNTPLYELVERLITVLKLEKLSGQEAYLFSFFDELQIFLEDNPSDIPLFLTYWDEVLSTKSIPAGQMEGIRILTIHKSKGLQFHTVLIPYCHWNIEKDRIDSLLWCKPEQAPYNELPLVPITTKSSARKSIYAKEYNEEHLQRRIENLNLLYVAFTRAEKNLFVWAATEESKNGKIVTIGDLLLQVLQDEIEMLPGTYRLGSLYVTPPLSPHNEENKNRLCLPSEPIYVNIQTFENRIEFRQSNASYAFLQNEEDEEFNRHEEYIHQGNLLHTLFSVIETKADIEPAIRSLEMQGLIDSETDEASLRKLILRGLQSPDVSEWFDGSWRLFKECTILSKNADGSTLSRRPDRVMTRNNEVVIIDFKFGRSKPEHREQVCEYIQLLQQMGYTNIRGYLWYVYTNRVEPII